MFINHGQEAYMHDTHPAREEVCGDRYVSPMGRIYHREPASVLSGI